MKVKIDRFPHDGYGLVGPPTIVDDLSVITEKMVKSGFLLEWLKARVTEALLNGEVFESRSSVSGQLRATYKLATEQEILDFADAQQVEGKGFVKKTARAKSVHYEVTDLDHSALPRQAQVILEALKASGRDQFTEASVEVVITASDVKEALKTKQDPMKIFGFYRRRLVNDGFILEKAD